MLICQIFDVYLRLKSNSYLRVAKIIVQNAPITVIGVDGDDYISLTDMAKKQLQEHIIFRWLSLKGTIEYLS
jgi:hypothetical protein